MPPTMRCSSSSLTTTFPTTPTGSKPTVSPTISLSYRMFCTQARKLPSRDSSTLLKAYEDADRDQLDIVIFCDGGSCSRRTVVHARIAAQLLNPGATLWLN